MKNRQYSKKKKGLFGGVGAGAIAFMLAPYVFLGVAAVWSAGPGIKNVLSVIRTHNSPVHADGQQVIDVMQGIFNNAIQLDGIEIHLAGVSIPGNNIICVNEHGRNEGCGSISQRRLLAKAGQEPVTCVLERDYSARGREATCYQGQTNLNAWLVGQGYGLANRDAQDYLKQQQMRAQSQGFGLWANRLMIPTGAM